MYAFPPIGENSPICTDVALKKPYPFSIPSENPSMYTKNSMKKTHLTHKKLTSVGLMALTVGTLALKSQAASVLFDFNSDPTTSGLLTLFGTSTWVPSGGVGSSTNANDGYLQVTAAAGSQRGAIVFSDFDGGQVVQAFTFE